jgi:hypothetical protein
MGCGSSSPAGGSPPGGGANTANNGSGREDPSSRRPPPQSSHHQNGGSTNNNSSAIDSQLERARAEEEGKIKMLLLGAGESGKSTIFKQMRLLYNTADRSDDDLRMYGVVVRSNIVVAVRKLCAHLRNLGLEEELDRESVESDELDSADHGSMTVRQAYDELMAYLVDNTANNNAKNIGGSSAGPSSSSAAAGLTSSVIVGGSEKYLSTETPMDSNKENNIVSSIIQGGKKDWVGQSPRAGLAANNDAKQFLAHHESIKILWQVSFVCLLE